MKISRNITYAEAIHSNTAKRKGIDNTPNPAQVENMKVTAEKVRLCRDWDRDRCKEFYAMYL